MDTASDFDSIFFARAWCCCWFVVRWFKARINFQIRAAADFWFFLPCEQTPFFSFFKFRRKPLKSIGCSRVVVVYKIYNTHTTFHPQHNNNNTCRTTKVAVPLLMSTSTTIYSPVQTCVLFNVIVSRVNSRFCSCCVCWYFSLRQQRTSIIIIIIIIFITNASTSHEKQFETHSQMLSPSTRLLPIAWMVRFY